MDKTVGIIKSTGLNTKRIYAYHCDLRQGKVEINLLNWIYLASLLNLFECVIFKGVEKKYEMLVIVLDEMLEM